MQHISFLAVSPSSQCLISSDLKAITDAGAAALGKEKDILTGPTAQAVAHIVRSLCVCGGRMCISLGVCGGRILCVCGGRMYMISV